MYYFLVYNDNTHWHYLNPLLESVKKHGPNFQIIIFNKEDIDPDFVEENKDILNCERGGGYWLWKPYIINYVLNEVDDDDIVFYCDLKFFFIDNICGLYEKYFENSNNELLVWKNKPNEPVWYMKNWCKMDVIVKYNMYEKVFIENCEDSWAGAMVIKKTDNTIKYIKEWLDMCCIYDDITDEPCKIENRSEFEDHRHDQSLLTIVLYKYNIEMQDMGMGIMQNCRMPY